MSAVVQYFEYSLALPFFGFGMKTNLFQSCGLWRAFLTYCHIESSALIASSFRIWNSSNGIPLPPLALFVVILPKACLTSQSKMSALGEWSHHHGYLGHEDHFLYSSVYSCHLSLVSSPSVRSISFLSFIVSIFAWYFSFVSLIFLKRSLFFFHSIVFLYFFALFV